MRLRVLSFIVGFLAPLAILAGLIVINMRLLDVAREYADVSRIVQEQRDTGGLYNGVIHTFNAYKFEAFKQLRPKAVVIGSSRSLQVRDYFFKTPFYNLGGAVSQPTKAFAVLDRAILEHPPEHVIWFLDFWHFCVPESASDGEVVRPFTGAARQNIERTLVPFKLWMQDHLPPLKKYLDAAINGQSHTFNGIEMFGLNLMPEPQVGFGPDGSMYNALQGEEMKAERRASYWMERIGSVANGALRSDCRLSASVFAYIDLFAKELAAENIGLTLISAPMPGRLIDRMRNTGKYAYIDEWRVEMRTRFDNFYDAYDTRQLGDDVCEYIDFLHGGDVTYMRIFKDIAKRPGTWLGSNVDVDRLGRLIVEHAGSPIVADNHIGKAFARNTDKFAGDCELVRGAK